MQEELQLFHNICIEVILFYNVVFKLIKALARVHIVRIVIVSYDAMRVTKMEDYFLYELNHHCCITLADRFCLNPLGKFINQHQEVGFLVLRPLERSNHINPLDYKRPRNWNHPQFFSRHMSLSRKLLTAITLTDRIRGISMSRQQIKSMMKGFSH